MSHLRTDRGVRLVRRHRWHAVLATSLLTVSCGSGPTASVSAHLIHAGWEMRQADDTVWMAASIPGTVHTDLLTAGAIPDPFYADNERRVQWVEDEDWEYRTSFTVTEAQLEQDRHELVFDGLDTYADVVLNGMPILSADNMFRRWVVDVGDVLQSGPNSLVVRFRSPLSVERMLVEAYPYHLPMGNDTGDPPTRAFTRKAAYHYGWDWGARFVTSGIWRPVTLRSWSGIRIDDVWPRQRELTDARAELEVRVVVIADSAMRAEVRVRTAGERVEETTVVTMLTTGENTVVVPHVIADPQRWWPRSHGSPYLYDLTVEVEAGGGIDRYEQRLGLRTLEVVTEPDSIGESFYLRVNGVPVFAKGANYVPLDHFTPRVTSTAYRMLFDDIAAANMNMVRVWGGGIYERDVFYDLADEYGVLVWQDFMFANAMYPGESSFVANVRREAEDNVRRLRHHASLALWCGNNEIDEAWHNWGWQRQYGLDPDQAAEVWAAYRRIFHEVLPDVVVTLDPDRFYWPSSPSIGWGHDSSLTRGDAHYWGVWHGRVPFSLFRERIPRFMSEFGFQAYPSMATVAAFAPQADHDLTSPVMRTHQKAPDGNGRIVEYMARWYRTPRDFESFVYLSQLLQAEGMRLAFEAHRTAKPRTMGTLYWQLNDTWPVVSWSGRDYYGRWKALHYAVQDAFADPLISIGADRDSVRIRVLTDQREPVSGQLTVTLLDFAGGARWREERPVSVPPNGSMLVMTIDRSALLAGTDPAAVLLHARLEHAGGRTTATHYFARPKDLQLPADPGLSARWEGEGEQAAVAVTTQALARNVMLRTPDVDGRFSDNFFDLLPGERRVVRFRPFGSNATGQPSITVRSLVDAMIEPSQ